MLRAGRHILLILLAACSSPLVDVDITADGCPVALAERMTVEMFDGEGRLVRALDVATPNFPSGVRLIQDDSSATWRVRAVLFDENDVAIASIEATGDFSEPSAALHFEDRCLGVICSEGESCVGGACGRPAPRSEPLAQCPAWLFVSTEGTDNSMCGNFAAPCRTVAHLAQPGAATAAAGGVINVAGGVYGQGFLLPGHHQGPMVVRAWPDTGRPVFRMAGEDAIRVWTSDVTIQDVDVEGATIHGILHNVTGSHSNFRIRRCNLRNNGTNTMDPGASGIFLQTDLSDFDVEDCIFDGHPRRAVYVGNVVSNGRFRRNRFTNNNDGILVIGEATEIEITDNVFLTAERGIVFQNDPDDPKPVSVRIEHNRFCQHADLAVAFPSEPTSVMSLDRNTFIGNATGLRGGAVGETKSFAGNLFAQQTAAAIQLTIGAAPTEGPNLFFDNEANFSGYESQVDNIEANPGVIDATACSLERTNDEFAAFGAR